MRADRHTDMYKHAERSHLATRNKEASSGFRFTRQTERMGETETWMWYSCNRTYVLLALHLTLVRVSDLLPTRRYASAVYDMTRWLSIRHKLSKRLNGSSWISAQRLHPRYILQRKLSGNSRISQNMGISRWNFVPNSELSPDFPAFFTAARWSFASVINLPVVRPTTVASLLH